MMTDIIEKQIEFCEQRLKQAMLQSDLVVLDALLATDLLFTNHLGQTMTKQDDIQAHQNGVINIKSLSLSHQKIQMYEKVAIVSVQADITGIFNGIFSESVLCFTRVWHQHDATGWRVIAGHSSLLV